MNTANDTHHRKFIILLGVAALSGAAALGHQTVWVRAMVDVLGGNADTFSKVIGAFFIGLALGAGAASMRLPKPSHRWLWLLVAELGVVALALPILLVYPFSEWFYGNLAFGRILQWILPLVLVTPPAAVMGLFLPWLFHAMELERELTPGRAVALYAVNTLGGVVAIAVVILVLLPTLGLIRTALGVMGANALVIGAFLFFHFQRRPVSFEKGSERSETAPAKDTSGILPAKGLFISSLAFASGFAMLAREVLFQHQIAQISVNSLYSSGSVLAGVLLCLGLASLLVPLLVRCTNSVVKLLIAVLFLTAFFVAFQPAIFHLYGGLEGIPYGGVTPFQYGRRLLGRALVVIGPAVLLGGLVFPLLIHSVTRRGERDSGRAVGRLLLWNGLGGWLGPEAANLFFGPVFGLWQSLPILSGIYLLFAIWLVMIRQGHRRLSRRTAAAAGVGLALVVFVGGMYTSREMPHVNPGRTSGKPQVIDYRVGHEGVIAVVENEGHLRLMRNSTYTLGGTRALAHQERQGLLPLMLHENPKTVGVLGTATGSTLAGAALHPDVEHIEGIEISRDTYRLAREHFTDFNRDVFSNPRVHAIVEDARWVVANRRSYYDVVVGDVFMPWKTGTGRIYTREHFQSVRESLKPGGIYCQWFAMFQLSPSQFWTILSTFQDVFPETVMISVDFFSERPILGLIGGFSLADHDWNITREAAGRLRQQSQTGDPLLRHVEGVQMLMLGNAPRLPEDTPRNTLRNAYVELHAGRNLLTGDEPWLTGRSYREFVSLVRENSALLIPFDHRAAQFFVELDSASERALKERDPAVMETIPEIIVRLPEVFLSDSGADWSTWPSGSRPVLEYIFTTGNN